MPLSGRPAIGIIVQLAFSTARLRAGPPSVCSLRWESRHVNAVKVGSAGVSLPGFQEDMCVEYG